MRRLIEKGLMFADLVLVESPVLVERYRRALRHLTGRDTALSEFHIDISGVSPEVGDELGDPFYLNQEGFDRQFILLDLAQARAPLLFARFSTVRGILRQFIAANEAQLFALTARDAVAGTLAGSALGADTPQRLLESRSVTVEADTTTGTVATAERLEGLIRRFKDEPDAWCDEALIAEMIALAQRTGDLSRNPLRLPAMSFRQDSFWTSLFGGLYVLRSVERPGVISVGPKDALGRLPVDELLDFNDRTGIARFLAAGDLVEPIVTGRGPEVAAVLRQKMDFIVADVAGQRGEAIEGASRRDLRALARRYARDLPAEWQGLAALVAWAEDGAPWPRIASDHPAYFYTLRPKRRPDADLVAMLLSELAPLDVRQLYVCHREAFYRLYRGWPEAKKAYVAEALAQEARLDEAGTREALWGPEAPMRPPPAPVGPWTRGAEPPPTRNGTDLIARVGPWGALRDRPRRR